MDSFRIETLAAGQFVQFLEYADALLRRLLRADDLEAITAIADMHIEPPFYLAQVLVTLPAQIRQGLIIQRLEHDLEACL